MTIPGRSASSVMPCAQNVVRRVTSIQYASVPGKSKTMTRKGAQKGAEPMMKVASLPQTNHPGPITDPVNGAKQVHKRASKQFIGYLAFANQTRAVIVKCCTTTVLNP